MKRESNGPVLSAVFVDYDNIYMSLKRKSEDAAKRFAKDAPVWIRAIENGQLITATNGVLGDSKRRIVMNRCYGNPVPRRNSHDNSTDMNSFPFVRHHFLRAGFEVVDCPPLTAQLKNSADIRMVMDMRDYLTHDTYFDEFVILSGDADFTPVLHRLRQHARRTVIFANDYTAAPYTAICDGEVRESDLIALLLEGRPAAISGPKDQPVAYAPQSGAQTAVAVPSQDSLPAQQARLEPAPRLEDIRAEIIAEVVGGVRAAGAPVPLEALADRAIRALGHDRTIGTSWAGAGSFRELLRHNLPGSIRLTEQPPYSAYDAHRHAGQDPAIAAPSSHPTPRSAEPQALRGVSPGPGAVDQSLTSQNAVAVALERSHATAQTTTAPMRSAQPVNSMAVNSVAAHNQQFGQSVAPAAVRAGRDTRLLAEPAGQQRDASLRQPMVQPVAQHAGVPTHQPETAAPQALTTRAPSFEPMFHRASPAQSAPQHSAPPPRTDVANAVQQAIQRIYDAAQVPQLAPAEYRLLFEIMAQEINQNDLNGVQTLTAIQTRAKERGLGLERDEVKFVLEVVSEPDPWFEQGASVNIFAGRFRNYVVTRCRAQNLALSADELDLIDGWFASGSVPQISGGSRLALDPAALAPPRSALQSASPRSAVSAPEPTKEQRNGSGRWWSLDDNSRQLPAGEPVLPPQGGGLTEETDDFPRIVRTRQRG